MVTGEALPEAKVVRRELAGVPNVEVVGLSKEKGEETFWDSVTELRADLAGTRGSDFRHFARRMERNGHGGSTFPPWCVMIDSWIDAPWNGSATTS